MDDIDGSFFDHIDGLLDFPTEDIDSVFPAMGKSESILPSIWSANADSLPRSDSVFFGASSCYLSAELSIPYEDIAQLEWLSTFVEESFSGGSLDITPSAEHDIVPKNDRPFQTSSPISVLESSSSCSGEKTTVIPGKCGRARSKRTRPASFSPRPAVIHLLSPLPQCSVHENDHQGLVPAKIPCESSESFVESYNPAIDILKEAVAVELKKKKKKIKLTLPPKAMTAEVELEDDDRGTTQVSIRKCLHCHITKTPQWRAGPLGPKTLCNACGVRYKSGRLFPEYRPAASPTFVPLLHSNSHKKVLEMRNKTGEKPTAGISRGCIGELIVKDAPELIVKDAPELIPNTGVVQMDYM